MRDERAPSPGTAAGVGAAPRCARVVAAIALGANLGEPERTFKRALARLEQVPGVTVLRRSRWHVTAPVGGPVDSAGRPTQPDYLNGVVLVETTLAPGALFDALQALERHFGRDREREVRNGPRTLDLDLLYYGDLSSEDARLTLPHPRMEDRTFVLAPLAELVPNRLLPRSGRTVAARLSELAAAGREARPIQLEEPAAARAWCAEARARGATIGFVPTMGALHAGHLDLVRRAARENDLAVVSVFVNPLQFNDPRDLARYPRDFAGDAALLSTVDCAMVFTGTLAGFFPELPPQSSAGANVSAGAGMVAPGTLVDPGGAAQGLEGAHRPGHFEGVATIVARLFDVVQPTRAYFGQKDFQQTLVVRDLAARTAGPEVVVCPTVREPSGLARSSRNALLSPDARHEALAISRALGAARAAWQAGVRDPEALAAALRGALGSPAIDVEYAEVRDPEAWTAEMPAGPLQRAVALVAAQVGGVRLIDNTVLSEPDLALP
ncbi:MAG: pantoate--beta-alanine ligase [Planctomycetota bacterium]